MSRSQIDQLKNELQRLSGYVEAQGTVISGLLFFLRHTEDFDMHRMIWFMRQMRNLKGPHGVDLEHYRTELDRLIAYAEEEDDGDPPGFKVIMGGKSEE